MGLRKDIKLKVFLWCEMEKDLVDFVYMSRKNKRSDELLITEYGMLAAGLLAVAVIQIQNAQEYAERKVGVSRSLIYEDLPVRVKQKKQVFAHGKWKYARCRWNGCQRAYCCFRNCITLVPRKIFRHIFENGYDILMLVRLS